MATHSSILAWEIPRTEEPGGYSPWGCKRVGHDLVTKQRMGTQVVHIEEYKDTVYICSVCGWREYLTTCVSVFAHVHP